MEITGISYGLVFFQFIGHIQDELYLDWNMYLHGRVVDELEE